MARYGTAGRARLQADAGIVRNGLRCGAFAGVLMMGSVPPAGAQVIDTLVLRDHARTLAADSMLGRDTGSPGARMAASYIAGQLARLGLHPLSGDSFENPVPLVRAVLRDDSHITLQTPERELRFGAGEHFIPGPSGRGALHGFEGPVVFLPPGASLEAAAARGAVLLPAELSFQADADRLRSWIDAGVAGVILPVPDPRSFAALRADERGRLLVDAVVDDPIWQPDLPLLLAGPELVRALIGSLRPPPGEAAVRLDRSVVADLRFDTEPVAAVNVGGRVEGSDPDLRAEIVLLTAHFDHLGVGAPVDGDSIYNGFSDNAAGVAMLLAIAEAIAADPAPRTVAFLFTTGEERGLLGATAWAASPPFPLDRIHAVVNLDAGAPPAPPVRWRIAGDTTQPALHAAADVVRQHGWSPDLTGTNPNSDHWPFMARGIPALFLVPGRQWEGLDDAAAQRLFERWDRYHHPDDEWRAGFPLAGLQRYTRLALDITRRLAR